MMPMPTNPNSPNSTPLTDDRALRIVSLWRQAFPDATPLPGIGLPSQNNGVLTLTHTMHPELAKASPMTIDGLPSRSPLANNALFSTEVSRGGKYLTLYEIMLPEEPGKDGAPSTTARYTNAVARGGITVGGDHYHWKGGEMLGRFAIAIHTQAAGMDPETFTRVTIDALRLAMQGVTAATLARVAVAPRG